MLRRHITIAFVALSALVLAACGTSPFSGVDDPLAEQQYAIDQLNMSGAWELSDGSNAVVAVIDTGIDLDHPDLVDHIVGGWDFVDDDDTPNDENGHGTHVAGSAAAIGGNGIGVVGMAPNAKIMPLKVLGADGTGTSEDIAAAINWAVDHGANVINLSLGGTSDLLGRIFNKVDPSNEAIARADRRGVVVVAAAGNDSTYLTAYNKETPVIVVNASNEFGGHAMFSNFGDPRAVAAPGARILSTAPTYPTEIWPEGSEGYEVLSGTSMASPHVAGVAALMASRGMSPEEIRTTLTDTAENPDGNVLLGAGIVQADAAVEESVEHQRSIGLVGLLLMAGAIAAGFIIWERRRNA